MTIRNAAIGAALIGAAAAMTPAQAGTVPDGMIGCLTRDALREIIDAANARDERHFGALLNRVCWVIGGHDFALVETTFTSARIRVFVGDDSILLWTIREAVAPR